MVVVVDTSVLVALLNPQDSWHTQAVALQQALTEEQATLVFFDCVASEAVSAVTRRLYEKGRSDDIKSMLQRFSVQIPHTILTWILPDVPRLYDSVLALMHSSTGELNCNDSLIALCCRERNLTVIASFDGDFDRVAWLKRVTKAEDIHALLPS